jgi:DNA-binding transcriptional ArsR family regulator
VIARADLVRRFQALGDAQRLAIVESLRDEPRSVGDIAKELPISRPAVSRHLRLLKEAGVVTDQAAGNRRLYALCPGALDDMARYLDAMWDEVLARFALLANNASHHPADG